MPAARSSRFLVGFASLVLSLVFSADDATAAPITFRLAQSYTSGNYRQFVVTGDFDGDHQPDIAANQEDGTVRWWSNSHGVLGAAQPITLPFPVRSLAAGDLNGDGRADLVGCDDATPNGALAILLSNGAGFDPAIVVPTDSAGVTGVTLADLDGDGDLDLVAGNWRTQRVSRLFNDGSGHFSGLVSTFVPGACGRTWVVDLDGDGRLDILTGCWSAFTSFAAFNRPSWFLAGTGGGAFAAPVATGLTAPLALGHFSGPATWDAVVMGASGTCGIAPGLGNGTFGAPMMTAIGQPGCQYPWAATIDLDGDGRDELMTWFDDCYVTPTHSTFHVSAGLALTRRESFRGLLGLSPAIVDLDGDGRLDAVVSGPVVQLNHGGRLDGLRTLRTTQESKFDMNTQDLDVGDLNGDGAAEILLTDKHSLGFQWTSNHDGSFQAPVDWLAGTYIRQSALADVNGDGKLDALNQLGDPGSAYGLAAELGDGAGHFAPALWWREPFPPTGFSGANTADFDGDGDVDAIGVVSGGTRLFLNDGLGHFTPQSSTMPAGGTWGHEDGDVLPARFTTSGDNLSVERATSVGVLGAATLTPVGATLTSARFADVNGDGLTDAVCLVNGAQVRTFLGQPGGGWGPPVVSPQAPSPVASPAFAGIGDLDLDGRPDLIFTGNPSPISVMRNLGGGGFGERSDTNVAWPGTIAPYLVSPTFAADVDGDGAGDLVAINQVVCCSGGYVNTTVDVLLGVKNVDQPTPALVSLSSASATFERASLAWFVPSDGPGSLTLERRSGVADWSAIATVTPSAGRIAYDDVAVAAGATYSWRLAWQEGGATQHSEVATLAIPQRPRFAIAGVRPNPADGDRVSVSLTLDAKAPVDLAVVDVAGRIVASRRVVPSSVGRVDVAFDGLSSLRPALYFVRAVQAGRRATTTMVRLH